MSKDENYDPTPEQKLEWIQKALIQDGFERMSISSSPNSYYKEVRENVAVVVNLDGGQHDISFLAYGKRMDEDDKAGTLAAVGTMIANAMTGILPTTSTPDEVIGDVPPVEEPVTHDHSVQNETEKMDDDGPSPKPPSVHEPIQVLKQSTMPKLSIEIVKKYINEKVTDEEAYKFIQVCEARQLNPFLGQIHLTKKEFTGTAKIIMGKDAFIERAEKHNQYDGFEAGIIVKLKDGTIEDRPGAFHHGDEKILGGWAKVYRKDHAHFIESRVSMSEYDTGKATWAKMPATMIRKVAMVQSHREGFPSELGGLYDSSEMGVDV